MKRGKKSTIFNEIQIIQLEYNLFIDWYVLKSLFMFSLASFLNRKCANRFYF